MDIIRVKGGYLIKVENGGRSYRISHHHLMNYPMVIDNLVFVKTGGFFEEMELGLENE